MTRPPQASGAAPDKSVSNRRPRPGPLASQCSSSWRSLRPRWQGGDAPPYRPPTGQRRAGTWRRARECGRSQQAPEVQKRVAAAAAAAAPSTASLAGFRHRTPPTRKLHPSPRSHPAAQKPPAPSATARQPPPRHRFSPPPQTWRSASASGKERRVWLYRTAPGSADPWSPAWPPWKSRGAPGGADPSRRLAPCHWRRCGCGGWERPRQRAVAP
mmetsp:Transcript_106347/g.237361  ORF Transcript_106347/g.237361 Transcript_106347/m.237361 type:complete len:214 (-) Transcript_106347:120-761(-)